MTDAVYEWRSAAYRHARERDQARETLAAVREYLETSDDTGVRTREHCLGMLDQAGVPSPVEAQLAESFGVAAAAFQPGAEPDLGPALATIRDTLDTWKASHDR